MTDPNPLLTAEMGGLRIATDVVIDRPGVASPRHSFTSSSSKSSSQRPRVIYRYNSTTVVGSWDGASTWRVETPAAVLTGEAEPVDYTRSFVQFAEARRNLYWTSKAGALKITSGGDTAADQAGMHDAPSGYLSISSAGTPVVLPNNAASAWRWCFRKIDANSLETRSPPSPWLNYGNSTGATVDMDLLVPLPSYAVAGDQIELYRTNQVSGSSSTPSDQMYLVTRYAITSADVTAGYATVQDRVADSGLAQELYTNATREGALKMNSRPPASRAIASWESCLWFGGTIGPWTATLDLKTRAGAAAADGTAGWGFFAYAAAAATSGSPTITGLGSTNSVVVGQLGTDNAAPGTTAGTVPIGAKVISKTATTVTFDMNMTATGAITLRLHDGFKVGSETYWAASTTSTGGGSYPTFSVSIAGAGASVATQLAYSISVNSSSYYAMAINDPAVPSTWMGSSAVGTIIVRSVSLSDAVWTATAYTTAAAYSAPLTTAGAIVVQRDDRPNRVYYSKPSEPEHVPEGVNWIEVGNELDPILRLVPLRAALLVFKRDGIFRITGSAPDNWRVDLIDSAYSLIRAECVDLIENVAVAWCDRGVVEIDEGGVRSISDGKIGAEIAPLAQRVFNAVSTTGAWVKTWPLGGLVMVGVPLTTAAESTGRWYVYSVRTRAWTIWDLSAYCAHGEQGLGTFYYARAGAYWEVRVVRNLYVTPFSGYDVSWSLSGWTYDAAVPSITLTALQQGDWVPKVGDWVRGDLNSPGGQYEYRRIVTADTVNRVYTLNAAFTSAPNGGREGYEGIISKLQWQATTAGMPAKPSFWNRVHVLLDWTSYSGSVGGSTARLVVGGQTDVTSTNTTTTSSGETRAAKVFSLDVNPPRDLARAAHYYPYIETDDIGLEWRCNGVVLDFGEANRVNR